LEGWRFEANPRQLVCETPAPISKINRPKWTEGVTQIVDHLLCKLGSPEFKVRSHQKKKNDIFVDLGMYREGARIYS
jgi:hypothetical protein